MEVTCPIRIALHTTLGPVTRDSFTLAVMPSTDGVPISGCPTLEILCLDIYTALAEYAQQIVERRAKLMERIHYVPCRRISLSVEATMQQQLVDDE